MATRHIDINLTLVDGGATAVQLRVVVPIFQTVAYEFDDAQRGADLFDLAVPGNIHTAS